ncbi:MAG: alpha/beta hydrolase-fold protein, partial [Bacteroidota bacterium]|nr:alpha/beta hydrolase-fold protein [Bacteroidota bacterium]
AGTSAGMDPSSFFRYLSTLPRSERQIKVDSFRAVHTTFPLTGIDSTCSFFYFGEADSVSIAGDFTGWAPTFPLAHSEGTNLWFASRKFERDARIDYKFVINRDHWIKDPSNPDSCAGGAGTNSELKMPDYIVPPEILYHPEIPHGSMVDAEFPTGNIKPRILTIYLPPYYERNSREYAVIVFNDGTDYIKYGAIQNVLDYLIAGQQIEPVIGVFIPPVEREEEYAGRLKEDYSKFILETVMPVIEAKYNISRDPRKRIIAGSSNGGNISVYIALDHPGSFGRVIAQSSNVEKDILPLVQNPDVSGILFYLDIGSYDLPVLIPRVINFIDILQGNHLGFTYRQWHDGHSWGNWKAHIRYPLVEFLNPEESGNENNNSK